MYIPEEQTFANQPLFGRAKERIKRFEEKSEKNGINLQKIAKHDCSFFI